MISARYLLIHEASAEKADYEYRCAEYEHD